MHFCRTESSASNRQTGRRWHPVCLIIGRHKEFPATPRRSWRRGVATLLAASLPILSAHSAPPVATPADNAVLFEVAGADSAARTERAARGTGLEARLGAAENALRGFAEQGDPRRLGEAQLLLAGVPQAFRNGRYFALKARQAQSLHRFDEAMQALDAGLRHQPDSAELNLLKFSIALVQRDMAAASDACAALPAATFYGAGCREQLRVLEGGADERAAAFASLKQGLMSAVVSGDPAAAWLAVSLADAGERMGKEDAVALWQLALKLDSRDLYTRSRLCDAALYAGDKTLALSVSEAYRDIDGLALCHVEALQQIPAGEVPASIDRVAELNELRAYLTERFAEAEWRGEALHKRAQARYLLRIAERPREALMLAQANWQEQKELPDWRLLVEARRAVDRAEQR